MKFAAKDHRFGEKTVTYAKKLAKLLKNAKFDEHFEIRERCKVVHCVDLGESFQMHINLQNLASIQPRTSPLKFAGELTTKMSPAHKQPRLSSRTAPSSRTAGTKSSCASA